MINSPKQFYFILFTVCCIGWVACTQVRNPCETPMTATLNISTQHLISPTDSAFVDTALPSAVFIPLTTAANKTATIYPQQVSFTISLSPDSNICRWAFTPDTPGYAFDTLTFYYQKNLQFISNACGFTYFYNIDSVHFTKNLFIDSIHILNASVTNNVNTTQLQICIHPDNF